MSVTAWGFGNVATLQVSRTYCSANQRGKVDVRMPRFEPSGPHQHEMRRAPALSQRPLASYDLALSCCFSHLKKRRCSFFVAASFL